MGFSQNSYWEINGSAFLFFPFHFFCCFSSQKWHRWRGFNQPIPMNKWKRDPISSWQSLWKPGQLISQRSPRFSAEQPVLLPCAWCGRLPSAEVGVGGRHPWKATASTQLHLTASSCILPYLNISVFAKKTQNCWLLQTFLFLSPLIFFPYSQETSNPRGGQPKRNEMEISWCVFAVILGFGVGVLFVLDIVWICLFWILQSNSISRLCKDICGLWSHRKGLQDLILNVLVKSCCFWHPMQYSLRPFKNI